MNTKKTTLFGITIDERSKDAIPGRLKYLYELYKNDKIPKYATFINSYFFSHLHDWFLNSVVNCELLKIIRNADLVVLDTPRLCRISQSIGCSKINSISGEDLFLAACTFLDENSHSLFILGGNEEMNQKLLGYLRIFYPKIKLVGHATPLIITKGEHLNESQESDKIIIDEINKSKADLLILQLGHPKQEIWFERIKGMLRVPITIGIGGAIERFLSQISSLDTDKAKNQTSFSFYSIRKFIKHIPGYLKYGAWLFPLMLYNGVNHIKAKYFSSNNHTLHHYFFLSSNKSFIVIPFPTCFDSNQELEMAKWLEEGIEQDYIVLDFTHLKHIDLKGIAVVIEAVKWSENLGKKLFILNVHPDVVFLLKLHGIWNHMQGLEAKSPQAVVSRMSDAGHGSLHALEFYESIYQEKNEVILSFFGEFVMAGEHKLLMQKLMPILYQKNCTLNLNYCNYIDNRAIGFLLELKHFQEANGFSFKLAGINPGVARQLEIAKVSQLLTSES